MQILGLDPVIITMAICVIGVSFRIITGMQGKSWKEFNPTLALTTFMIAMIAAVGLVAPVIDALPDDMNETLQLAAIFGQIGLVIGLDAGVGKARKIAQKTKEKNEDLLFNFEPEPIDDDLPPGKDEVTA